MKHFFFISLFTLSFLGAMIFPSAPLLAATADLGISASNIHFSEDTLYAGHTVRLYAKVKNYGDVDVEAKVIFYQGAVLIGSSQTVSVLASGGSDDVYVDYVVPEGTFNIRALVHGQDPEDTNSANDEAITGLFTSVSDTDGDGVANADDNCVNESNPNQEDQDNDGMGDVCDDDRDGDGVSNQQDRYPDDASKSADPVPVPAPVQEVQAAVPLQKSEPVIVAEPVPVVTAPTSGTQVEKAPEVPAQLPVGNPGIFGFGTLSISPYAQFSYRQIDWRTYEFTALPSEGEGEITYAWDFGDGATSVQQTLIHAFPDAGQYVVTLAVIDSTGNMVSDAETFDISFFHLHNPWIQATLALLFFILLGLIWLIVRLKESKEERENPV